MLELDPSLATSLGIPGHETEYPDFSPAGAEAFAEVTREALRRLEDLEPTDDVDRVTLDAMHERLGLELEIHETGWNLADLNNIASPPQDIRAIFDLMPTSTVEDWNNIAGRMANVPDAIAGYVSSLREAKDRGLVAAKRQVRIVMEQTGAYAAEDGFSGRWPGRPRPKRASFPRICATGWLRPPKPRQPPTANLPPCWKPSCCRPHRRRTPLAAERYALMSRRFPGFRGGSGGHLRLGRGGAGQDHRGTGSRRRADPARRQHRGSDGTAGCGPEAAAARHG